MRYNLRRRVAYHTGALIGSGSFGDVYSGTDGTTGEPVAIKYERKDASTVQLAHEKDVYVALSGGVGIPRMLWYGKKDDKDALVLERLGPSLDDLHEFCDDKFTIKTVSMLACQLLNLLEHIHSKGFVHRDLKPENILMGTKQNEHQVYIIDYGLALGYCDPVTQEHIEWNQDYVTQLYGTPYFASMNAHMGHGHSRRDDLESLGYILVFFCRGALPWDGMEDDDLLVQKFRSMTPYDEGHDVELDATEELCSGLPQEFNSYFQHILQMGWEEAPDYSYLRGLFDNLLYRSGYQCDHEFDWCIDRKNEGNQ